MAARSSLAPFTEILNLRGRKANSGCRVLHWRRISQNGRGSAISSTAMPASASVAMLRMVLPLVWMPCMSTLASSSITSALRSSGIQLNCTFRRVVMWPYPAFRRERTSPPPGTGTAPSASCVAWASRNRSALGWSYSRAIFASTRNCRLAISPYGTAMRSIGA